VGAARALGPHPRVQPHRLRLVGKTRTVTGARYDNEGRSVSGAQVELGQGKAPKDCTVDGGGHHALYAQAMAA
jgi:hypothetical protein